MLTRLTLLSRVVLPALLATTALAQTSSPGFQFASDNSSLGIPVEIVANGLVLLQAQVNGHTGCFILDNGTQGFLVDPGFAAQNSLHAAEPAVTQQVGVKAAQAALVRDVTIALHGFTLTHRVLLVTPLKSLEPALGHTVDGIIGTRLFDDFVVAIDYQRHAVSIYAPDAFHPTGKETVLPVRIDAHGFQYVDATITLPGAAPASGSFLVDGGANYYANLYKPFADAHHLPPPKMNLLTDPGDQAPKDGRAATITVGPFSLKDPPITFAQDTEGLMASADYAGLIGAQFWQRFTVVFDNRNKRILLTPNSTYTNPAAYDQSGLKIHAGPPDFHRFVVTRVLAHSAASDAGIQPGDIINSIDRMPASSLTLSRLRNLLCMPNAHVTLGITRSDKHLSIAIQFHPLL
jgi:hypothetical protein